MDEILIEKVRKHEAIYDHSLADYRDQHIRQTVWEEIGKELKIPGNQAKEQWNKLRRCFCNARNRRHETKNGKASKKKSFWKYEQQMAFLIPFTENKKTHNNLKQSHVSDTLKTEPEIILSKWSDTEEIMPLQLEREHINLDIESEQDAQSNENKKRKKIKGNFARRQHKYGDRNTGLKLSNKTNLLENMDDTDMFFLSMSRMTKQLPKVDQAQIKLALSNSVLSAEIRSQQSLSPTVSPIQQQSCSSTPSPLLGNT